MKHAFLVWHPKRAVIEVFAVVDFNDTHPTQQGSCNSKAASNHPTKAASSACPCSTIGNLCSQGLRLRCCDNGAVGLVTGFVSVIMTELKYLDKAVALVLGFIGSKMIADFSGYHISTEASLLVVGVLLGGGVAGSLLLADCAEETES